MTEARWDSVRHPRRRGRKGLLSAAFSVVAAALLLGAGLLVAGGQAGASGPGCLDDAALAQAPAPGETFLTSCPNDDGTVELFGRGFTGGEVLTGELLLDPTHPLDLYVPILVADSDGVVRAHDLNIGSANELRLVGTSGLSAFTPVR